MAQLTPVLPAQRPWVVELPVMMQSVIFAAVRAPDGLRKDHPVKCLMRWYRRSVLMLAFEKEERDDPFSEGGGSFTGPFTAYHFWHFIAPHRPWLEALHDWQSWEDGAREKTPHGERCRTRMLRAFNDMRNVYLRHVDEMPHHFQLHFMHAAQIVGAYHPNDFVRVWWEEFYLMIVNDAHLHPESFEELRKRLSDSEEEWRSREQVTAR